jgi:myo-inositol-1(or 4)-monophosphatase
VPDTAGPSPSSSGVFAAGRLDAYVERDIKPWDHAGGALIAGEAGAMVELPCPENDNLVLAGNATIHRLVRGIVANS